MLVVLMWRLRLIPAFDCFLGETEMVPRSRVRLSGFGHVGMGGSIGLCDPASGLAFAMTTNKVLLQCVICRVHVPRAREKWFMTRTVKE